MTEAEWLKCTDSNRLLLFRRHNLSELSERKTRLFACACCRRIWGIFPDGCWKDAVQMVEQVADGLPLTEEMRAAFRDEARSSFPGQSQPGGISFAGALFTLFSYAVPHIGNSVATITTKMVARAAAQAVPKRMRRHVEIATAHEERRAQSDLLRCIFGNPFRPVTLDGAWLSPAVTALARAIYDERRFEDLPILGDALEEAGCTSDDILGHCRSPGPHARGCWVVDLVLAKE